MGSLSLGNSIGCDISTDLLVFFNFRLLFFSSLDPVTVLPCSSVIGSTSSTGIGPSSLQDFLLPEVTSPRSGSLCSFCAFVHLCRRPKSRSSRSLMPATLPAPRLPEVPRASSCCDCIRRGGRGSTDPPYRVSGVQNSTFLHTEEWLVNLPFA